MTDNNNTKALDPVDKVKEVVNEVIEGTPLFIIEINVRGRKGSQVVDIFLDSDEILDIEELARVSREVGFLLDAEEVFDGSYSLNVSSPGLDRPLSIPRQYRKNIGRVLRIKYLQTEGEGTTSVTGELKGTDENSITIETGEGETIRIPFSNITEAKVKLPW